MNGFRLTPGEPFEPSARAWNRAQDAADIVLRKTTITGVPRGDFIGGGGSATPYIITEEAYGGGNVLLHRCSEPFSVQRCESSWVGDGNDVEMSAELLQGVTATGCVVTGQSLFGDLYATGGGQASSFLARCVTDEEILPGDSGSITVTYLKADETEAEATIGNVMNNAGLTATVGISVGVLYDSLSCTFSIFDIGCSG